MQENTLQLRYFAWVRERVGTDIETVTLPEDVRTVAELVTWLRGRGAPYESVFADAGSMRVAVDRTLLDFDASVVGVDEVAFFPPMTGG